MFFAINTSRNIGVTVEKTRSLLIEIPDPYIGTDIQIKILNRKAFKKFEKDGCLFESQVEYIGNELIPNIPPTEKMEADIIIPSGEWI